MKKISDKTAWSSIVGVALVVLIASWYLSGVNAGISDSIAAYVSAKIANAQTNPTGTTTTTQSAPVVGPGEHCGGNMLNAPVCGPGYTCTPEAGSHLPFGDVGGICTLIGGKG